jgi:hypothetical protein
MTVDWRIGGRRGCGAPSAGRAALGLAFALATAGCGLFHGHDEGMAANDGPPYEEVLNRWMGRSETDLINNWGVPSRSQLLSSGGQVLEYQLRDDKHVYCSTLFTTNLTGTIERYTFHGTDCRPPVAAVAGG